MRHNKRNWNNTDISTPIIKIVESADVSSRYPYQYFLTLTMDAIAQSKMNAQMDFLDMSIRNLWIVKIRRYFVKLAKSSRCEILYIPVIDYATSFHAVVLATHSISADEFFSNWTHTRSTTIKQADGQIRRFKDVSMYRPEGNALAYMYDHHLPLPAEHVVSRRAHKYMKKDELVKEINQMIKAL